MAEPSEELNIPPLPVIPTIKCDYKFGSLKPRDPEEYQIGDSLVDFFPLTKCSSPLPVPDGLLEAMDRVLEARKKSDMAQLAFMDALIEYERSSFDVMIAWARSRVAEAQADAIRDHRLKLKATIMGSQPPSSGETTPDPMDGQPDARRDRLAGVDVSKLPAGFGKRRASGASASAKRPKTPTEGAPEIKEPTPAATP